MKTRKAMAMLVAVGVLGFFSMRASGAEAWYTCQIDQVGQGWGTIYIQLTDTAGTPVFTQKWALGPSNTTEANRLLAIALTAINGTMTANVKIDAAVSYPQILAFYLVGQ